MSTVGTPAPPLRVACACIALALPFVAACSGDSLKPPPLVGGDLYWDAELSHHAVMLSTTAPYDTLTLSVNPRNVRGEALSGAPAPRFLSRDINHVVVTADGVLHAVAAASEPVWVLATLTWGELTYSDSVLVKVSDEPAPPVLASFSIHPIPPDSAKVAVASSRPRVLPVQAADGSGTPLVGVVVSFHSSDTNVVTVHRTRGLITGRLPGIATIDASTTVYGVTKVDTVTYRIGWPVEGSIGIWHDPAAQGLPPGAFYPPEITVGVGALVFWLAQEKDREAIDVTFSEDDLPNVIAANTTTVVDPLTLNFFCSALQTDCNSGGSFVVPAGSDPGGAFRVLSTPGVYEYRSASLGMSARIVVAEDP